MINKLRTGKPTFDISDVNGNTCIILGFAKQFSEQHPHLIKDIDSITKQMIASDYPHLIAIFKHHFGQFVDIKDS